MAYLNVTVDSTYIDSTLTNFPIGIELDSTDTILFGLGPTAYEGFHFTVSGVECYAHIDIWDMTNEKAVVWVLVPSVSSSSDTIIKIENVGDDNTAYVGISGSTPAETVYDSNAVGVWHMSEDPSAGNVLDATANSYDAVPGTTYSSSYWDYGGFGKAIDFTFLASSAANQGLNVPYNSDFNIQNLTVLAMVKPNAINQLDLIAVKRYASASPPYNSFGLDIANSYYRFFINNVISNSSGPPTTDWAILVGTYDGSNRKFYIDGVLDSDVSQSITIPYTSLGFFIADYGNNFEFGGRIAEVHLYNDAKSAAWIKAISNNLLGNLISSKTLVTPPPGAEVFGQISISGKNVDILQIQIVDKGKWRIVDNVYMLIDKDWRLNIIS